MICPTCNEDDIGEPPWESWHRCANCDVHPETSLHMKAQRERIAALEAKLEAMERTNERMRQMLEYIADNGTNPILSAKQALAAQEEKE